MKELIQTIAIEDIVKELKYLQITVDKNDVYHFKLDEVDKVDKCERKDFQFMREQLDMIPKVLSVENNDNYNRQYIIALLTEYLNETISLKKIYDFKVICDETVNSPSVINDKEYVLTRIIWKHIRSINLYQKDIKIPITNNIKIENEIEKFF